MTWPEAIFDSVLVIVGAPCAVLYFWVLSGGDLSKLFNRKK